MSIWYENPKVLLNDMNLIPFTNNINKNINSLARIAVLLLIYINLNGLSSKYNSIPIIILIFSYIMKPIEKFAEKKRYSKCRMPTKNNPFMNFTVGEYYRNPSSGPACCVDDPKVKKEMREKFLQDRKDYNVTDFFNRNHSDIAFYTMPVTTVLNDQNSFGRKLLGDSGLCKSFGKNCVKNIDNRYHRSRYYYSY